jgi:hypothetical protein
VGRIVSDKARRRQAALLERPGSDKAYRASAIEEGRREPVKAYVVSAAPDPDLAARLGQTLARNGIEVTRASSAFQACGGSFAAGSLVVSAAQPTKRLIRTLMDEKTVMDPAFVARQDARTAKGLPDEIYDVTAWSLPLACCGRRAAGSSPSSRLWFPGGWAQASRSASCRIQTFAAICRG